MTVTIFQLPDDSDELEPIGIVEAGEIVVDDESLPHIPEPILQDEERLLDRFDGPYLFAEPVDARESDSKAFDSGKDANPMDKIESALKPFSAHNADSGWTARSNTNGLTVPIVKEIADYLLEEISEDRFIPPKGAHDESQEALDWIDEHGRDEASGGTQTGLARARQIVDAYENNEPIEPEYIQRIDNFFARHGGQGAKDLDDEYSDKPWKDNSYLAWKLWGGDPAQQWANDLWERIKEVRDEKMADWIDQTRVDTIRKSVSEWIPIQDSTGDEAWLNPVSGSASYADSIPGESHAPNPSAIGMDDVVKIEFLEIETTISDVSVDRLDTGDQVVWRSDGVTLSGEIVGLSDSILKLEVTEPASRVVDIPFDGSDPDHGQIDEPVTTVVGTGPAGASQPVVPDSGQPTDEQMMAELLRLLMAAGSQALSDTDVINQFVSEMRDRDVSDDRLRPVVEFAARKHPYVDDVNDVTKVFDVTVQTVDSVSVSDVRKIWIPYRGPEGGTGWQNTDDLDDVVYDDEPPGQQADMEYVFDEILGFDDSQQEAVQDGISDALDRVPDLSDEGRKKLENKLTAAIIESYRQEEINSDVQSDDLEILTRKLIERWEDDDEIPDDWYSDPFDDLPNIDGPEDLEEGDIVEIEKPNFPGPLEARVIWAGEEYLDVAYVDPPAVIPPADQPDVEYISDVIDVTQYEFDPDEVEHVDTDVIEAFGGPEMQDQLNEVFGRMSDVMSRVEDRVLFDDSADERDPYEWYEAVIEVASEDPDVPLSQIEELNQRLKEESFDPTGMTENERLENAFEYASKRVSAREWGISGGNTTGDEMEVLEYGDGSFDLAIPVDAYPGPTGVVSTQQEAIENNTNGPRIENALGGNSVQTALVEDPDGEEYIVKDGLDGQVLGLANEITDFNYDVQESAVNTMAAAFFTGHNDLHRENVFVTDDDEFYIIDHDAQGEGWHGMPEPWEYAKYDLPDDRVKERIAQLAAQIVTGERQIPDDITTRHRSYVERQIENAYDEIDSDQIPDALSRQVERYRDGEVDMLIPDEPIADVSESDIQELGGEERSEAESTDPSDERFTTYDECVEYHSDKRDPEAYCAVVFGFDEIILSEEESSESGNTDDSADSDTGSEPVQ